MTDEKLLKLIDDYLEQDAHSAIMIDGEWGIGKSYFIKNVLKEHLDKKEKKVIINISLYGLSEIAEISKKLFFEFFLPNKIKKELGEIKKPVKAGMRLFAKTIIESKFSSYMPSEKNIKKLYESISLTNGIIVFDDLERTSIDIIELLGYINNFVENDGAKVIIVGNQKEIYSKDADKKSKYEIIREKTISDVVEYKGDFAKAVKSIIDEYRNKHMISKEIYDIISKNQKVFENAFLKCDYNNLRTVKYIIEKYKHIDKIVESIFCALTIDDALKQNILEEILSCLINYSIYIKLGHDKKELVDRNVASIALAMEDNLSMDSYVRMIAFVLDYINLGIIDEVKAKSYILEIIKKNAETIENNVYSKICDDWFKMTDEELIENIAELELQIMNKEISVNEYVSILSTLNFFESNDIIEKYSDKFLVLMLKNIKKLTKDDKVGFSDYSTLPSYDQKYIDKFNEQVKELTTEYEGVKSQNFNNEINDKFCKGNAEELAEYCEKHHSYFLTKKSCLAKVDVSKFSEVLKNCSNEDLAKYYKIFSRLYDLSVLTEDVPKIKELIDYMSKIKPSIKSKIRLYAWNNSIGRLEKFVIKLEGKIKSDLSNDINN